MATHIHRVIVRGFFDGLDDGQKARLQRGAARPRHPAVGVHRGRQPHLRAGRRRLQLPLRGAHHRRRRPRPPRRRPADRDGAGHGHATADGRRPQAPAGHRLRYGRRLEGRLSAGCSRPRVRRRGAELTKPAGSRWHGLARGGVLKAADDRCRRSSRSRPRPSSWLDGSTRSTPGCHQSRELVRPPGRTRSVRPGVAAARCDRLAPGARDALTNFIVKAYLGARGRRSSAR